MKSATKSAASDSSVDTLKREVARLKASLLLHDRMGRLQLGTARQWQAVFDALSFPMAVVDAEGHIIQANRAMTELVGKPCLDVVGGTCWQMLHHQPSRIDDCLFVAMKKGRKSVSAEREGCGYRLQVNLDPLFDEKGRVAGAVHTITSLVPLNGRIKRRKTAGG